MRRIIKNVIVMIMMCVMFTACGSEENTTSSTATKQYHYTDIGSSGDGGAFLAVEPDNYLKNNRIYTLVYWNYGDYDPGAYQVHYINVDGVKYEATKTLQYDIQSLNSEADCILFSYFGLESIELSKVETIEIGVDFINKKFESKSAEITVYPLE